MKIYKLLLTLLVAASIASFTSVASASYCYKSLGYWRHGHYHTGRHHCRAHRHVICQMGHCANYRRGLWRDDVDRDRMSRFNIYRY